MHYIIAGLLFLIGADEAAAGSRYYYNRSGEMVARQSSMGNLYSTRTGQYIGRVR